MQGDVGYLVWNGPTLPDFRFEIYTKPAGESAYQYNIGGNINELKMPVFFLAAGNYHGVQVRTVYGGQTLASSQNDDLSITVNKISGTSAEVHIQQDASYPNQYCAEAIGLTSYTTFSMNLKTQPDAPSQLGQFGATEGNGGVTRYFDDDDGSYCVNGYFQIGAGKNYVLSNSGKTITFDAAVLNDWTKCSSVIGS